MLCSRFGEIISIFSDRLNLPNQSPPNRNLLRKLDELDLSIRTTNSLKNATSVQYIGDLVQKTDAELLRLPNFGRKSLNEIKEVLGNMGLRLDMKLSY
jgi:DNA-directed RNA polymerase subunit alpha